MRDLFFHTDRSPKIRGQRDLRPGRNWHFGTINNKLVTWIRLPESVSPSTTKLLDTHLLGVRITVVDFSRIRHKSGNGADDNVGEGSRLCL